MRRRRCGWQWYLCVGPRRLRSRLVVGGKEGRRNDEPALPSLLRLATPDLISSPGAAQDEAAEHHLPLHLPTPHSVPQSRHRRPLVLACLLCFLCSETRAGGADVLQVDGGEGRWRGLFSSCHQATGKATQVDVFELPWQGYEQRRAVYRAPLPRKQRSSTLKASSSASTERREHFYLAISRQDWPGDVEEAARR